MKERFITYSNRGFYLVVVKQPESHSKNSFRAIRVLRGRYVKC